MKIIFIIFILKLIDCSMGTLKNLFLIKNNYLVSAILAALCSLVWYVTVLLGVKSNGLYSTVAITFATFIGTYFTGIAFKSKQKEKVWTFNITMASQSEAKELERYCKEHGIQYAIAPCLNERFYCKLFSKSREQSLVIKDIVKNFNDSDIVMLIESSLTEVE